MIKSELTDGQCMYVVKVEHFVTLPVFAKALSSHFYSHSNDFPEHLSKTEAIRILKTELRYGGDQSAYDIEGVFQDATDFHKIYQPIFKKSLEWIKTNYPYLKESRP